MPWYFYLAFKQLFPSGKRFSFFAVMAIIGVTLGVMVLAVVTTVMNGFAEKIRSTVHNAAGDIRIESHEGIYDTKEFLNKVNHFDFVEAAAPYAMGMVMLKNQAYPGFPFLKGIDYQLEEKVLPIQNYIIAGDLKNLEDDSIILGSGFAKFVGATLGSTVEVYTPLMLERMKKDEVLLPRELKVVGIYETGWNAIDSKSALIPLNLMQELYGMGEGIHGASIKLKPNVDINFAATELKKAFSSPYNVISWLDDNQEHLFVLKLEKVMMFFIMIFIILVASFSIASSLMTSVVRKIREIGLIGAMGGSSSQIALCFCSQGFFIGVVGTILGCILGIIAIYFRNGIVHSLLGFAQKEDILSNFYQFADVPAYFLMSDFIIISLSAILIATFAGLLPAIKAARLKPSEALRND